MNDYKKIHEILNETLIDMVKRDFEDMGDGIYIKGDDRGMCIYYKSGDKDNMIFLEPRALKAINNFYSNYPEPV